MYSTSDPLPTSAAPDEATATVGAIILAGGRGERLSADKGCLTVGDQPLVARVLAAARAVADRVVVVGLAPQPAGLDVPVIADDGPGPGPVRGLITGLEALGMPLAVLLAWDMPFVAPALLRHLVALADNDTDAVVPRVGGRAQPLCAVYAHRALDRLRAAAAAAVGDRGPSLTRLLEQLEVRWVEDEALARFGGPERLFFSVNAPADLARAREMDRT